MDFTPLDTNILRMPKSLRNQQSGGFFSKYIKPVGQGLLTMGKQLGGAIGQGVSEGFGVVGKTINQTPGLKQGVGVLNALDYGLGTAAKTTEGLLTKPRETLMNLKYRPGEGLQGYAQRNVTDITPYVSEKVAGTPLGQKMPMLAPLLGLGAGMLTPSPSDALKVGKFASQAGDIAKFSDEATELVKPSMLADKLYHVSDNPNLKIDTNYNPKQGQLGKGFYVTKNPETWQSGQIGNRPYVYEIDNAGLNIAKDYPTRDELIKWGSKNGYYTKDVLKKPDGNYVLGMDGKPMKVWQETPKALKLMEYQDPMTGSKMSGLEQEYLKSKGYDGVSASYSPDGEQSVIFNYDKIKIKPKVDPLTSEAKKYKTAEEFVKGQPTYYHGGDLESGVKQGLYLTSDKVSATKYSGTNKGRVYEYNVPKNIKLVKPSEYDTVFGSFGYNNEKTAKYFSDNGFDGMKTGDGDLIIFKPELLKTKSQLTDIWNKANKNNADDALINEARKYKSAEEFVKAQGTPVYHGTNVKNAEMIKNNPRLLSVEEQQQFPTTVVGDTQIGISSSKDRAMAEYFASLQPTNKGEVVDLVLPKNARIYKLPDGVESIDSLGLKELQRIKKLGFDAIEDTTNIGGESEIRILTPEILKTKSQLTDIWNKAQGN